MTHSHTEFSWIEDTFDVFAVVLTLVAVIAVANDRIAAMPLSISLSSAGAIGAILLLVLDAIFGAGLADHASAFLDEANFSRLVLHYILGFLLFAGSIATDVGGLQRRWREVASLSIAGVFISTAVLGLLSFLIMYGLGVFEEASATNWLKSLVYGAIVSPTDPVAVLGILKTAGAPAAIESTVIGESLFNDATGLLLFTVLKELADANQNGTIVSAEAASADGELFDLHDNIVAQLALEILGGIALGAICAALFHVVARRVEDGHLVVVLSTILAMDITFLAIKLELSTPLACVTAGLAIRRYTVKVMEEHVKETLETVWLFLEDIMNGVLFLLIGLQLLTVKHSSGGEIGAAFLAIPAAMIARFLSVGAPIRFLRIQRKKPFAPGTIRVLWWGGLRGAISIALVLSISSEETKRQLFPPVFSVVLFSLLVQGLTLPRLIRNILAAAATGSIGLSAPRHNRPHTPPTMDDEGRGSINSTGRGSGSNVDPKALLEGGGHEELDHLLDASR